jgi:hypothetical protein
MSRSQALPYVSFVVDDAGSGRRLGDDPHAIVRIGGDDSLPSRLRKGHKYPSVLIGWQCAFEPLFVAVHSYLDVRLDDNEAIELAKDYLAELNWFSDQPTDPDYLIR